MRFIVSGIFFVISLISLGNAQSPMIQWQKTYGGSTNEEANSIIQVDDGGFIIAGYSDSNNGDVTGFHSTLRDFWIVKIDSNGVLQWQKCLGGTNSESAHDIKETNGGFIIVGTAASDDGDVTGVHWGSPDYWIVKTDGNANIIWQKAYGGMQDEFAREVFETADSGFIIIGEGSSIDGDMFDNTHGTTYDYWVVKVDSSGNLEWQKAIGGYGDELATSIFQSASGDYTVGGTGGGFDHDVQCSMGSADFWIVNLNNSGLIIDQKCLGGSSFDEFGKMKFTDDGGYLAVGTTLSNDGDVSGLNGVMDVWLSKCDSLNNVQWQACLGGLSLERGFALDKTFDNGVVVAGATNSNDSIISSHGLDDFFVAKTDSVGNVLWSMALGGTNDDVAKSIIQCRDGGYLVAGYTQSVNGNVTFNHGGRDFWVVKLAPLGLEVPKGNSISGFTTNINTNQDLQIFFNSLRNEEVQLYMTDVTGKIACENKIKSTPGLNSHQFELNKLQSGIYFLSIFSSGSVETKKIIYH